MKRVKEKASTSHSTANADIPKYCLIIEHPLLIIVAADTQMSKKYPAYSMSSFLVCLLLVSCIYACSYLQ